MKFYVASTNQIPALGYVPQADCPIRVYISYQSDYHLRVCISHSHITAFGYLVQIIAFLATQWCHRIRGMCTKNDINQRYWTHLISAMVCCLCEILINSLRFIRMRKVSIELFCIIFKLKCVFPLPYLQCICQTHTMKTTSKVQSEHAWSLHSMNIKQCFTCLNCTPPIKFYFATLDFASSLVISL